MKDGAFNRTRRWDDDGRIGPDPRSLFTQICRAGWTHSLVAGTFVGMFAGLLLRSRGEA